MPAVGANEAVAGKIIARRPRTGFEPVDFAARHRQNGRRFRFEKRWIVQTGGGKIARWEMRDARVAAHAEADGADALKCSGKSLHAPERR